MQYARLVFFVVFGFFCFSGAADAATLYMSPNSAELLRGDTLSVAIRLDTDEDECVNAIDATITYSENIQPVDTSRGNSIMSVWLEEPVIDKEARTITFAGGIPNGYCGRISGDPRLTNIIAELLFRSPGMVVGTVADNDTATIDFASETRALLNDGFGTDAPLSTYGTEINLSKRVGTEIKNEWSDRINLDDIPPEEFTIQLERNTNAFSNKYYIIFNTTDKQTGIDHYEVIEEPLSDRMLFHWGAETAPWVTASSPFVLKDQSLNSTIRVRAIDKAGNEYVATLEPEEAKRTTSVQNKILIALIATVVIGLVGSAVIAFVFYNRRKKIVVDETDDDEYQD